MLKQKTYIKDENTSWKTVLSKEYNIIIRWGYNLFELAGQVWFDNWLSVLNTGWLI